MGIEVFDDDHLDDCMNDGCTCNCHAEIYDDIGIRFEAGVQKDGPLYHREGVFLFLKLSGEMREKIYGFAFLQDGKQRKTASHRGSIHTALLGTCRQIYNEARHLPLTINKLCFASPLFALDFLGFLLAPTQRDLVTSLHIEFHIYDFSNSSWHPLMRELAKMPISHLGLTIKGGVRKDQVSGHTCFIHRFTVLKGLKSLDFILTSAYIEGEEKQEIQEEMREKLINGYVRPKALKKSKSKRTASSDVLVDPKKGTKKVKKGNTTVSIIASTPRPSRQQAYLPRSSTRPRLQSHPNPVVLVSNPRDQSGKPPKQQRIGQSKFCLTSTAS